MTNKPMLSVERDERADFEKEVQAKAERFQPDFRRYGLHPDAEYKCANNQWAWELWQKRASMDKPAAQHQGEPVAICRLWNEGGSGERTSVEFIGEPCADGTLLYAEHPAPVAVVMPEHKVDPGIAAGLTSRWVQGWNEALAEVARLNGVKP